MSAALQLGVSRVGVSLFLVSGGEGCGLLVGLAVAEHGVRDVAAFWGEAGWGGVVPLALGSFAVVVGAAGGVGA